MQIVQTLKTYLFTNAIILKTPIFYLVGVGATSENKVIIFLYVQLHQPGWKYPLSRRRPSSIVVLNMIHWRVGEERERFE